MRPDTRSVSFTFHREVLSERNSPQIQRNRKNLRQRLQDRFDKDYKEKSTKADKSTVSKSSNEKSWVSLGSVSADSRRVLRHGAEKLSKTISSVRTTFGTFSQKFRSSTKRRQILDEQQSPSAYSMQTPQTRSRYLLGRTPTKLYSPFGFESPKHGWKMNKENKQLTPSSDEYNKSNQHQACKPFRFIKNRGFAALR